MSPSKITPKIIFTAAGKVVDGFKRGSSELGIPTANLSEDSVIWNMDSLYNGVFIGYSQIDNGPIYKSAISIGWNPFYHNKKPTIEAHLLHTFEKPFYGHNIRVMALHYLREQENYDSVDELIAAIRNDISQADTMLSKPEFLQFQSDQFFVS